MKSWVVTVKGWGQASTRTIRAASARDAEESMFRELGFTIEVAPHVTPEQAEAEARADEAKVRYLIEEGVVVVNDDSPPESER
jgi:hypothetical protein